MVGVGGAPQREISRDTGCDVAQVDVIGCPKIEIRLCPIYAVLGHPRLGVLVEAVDDESPVGDQKLVDECRPGQIGLGPFEGGGVVA